MKNTILFLAIALFVLGCKTETKETKEQEVTEKVAEEEKEFVAKMTFTTNKDGEFQMVLYNIKEDEYQNKYIVISEKIEATSNADYMTADFQENMSNNFRINLGNKETRNIEILTIELSYGAKKINISTEDIATYFNFNEFIKHDSITNSFTTVKVSDRLNPIIYLKPQYLRELKGEN
jgi:hypothetical protein